MSDLLISAMQLLAIGTLVVAAVMLVLWVFAVRDDNYSYVDIAWSLNFALLAGVYVVLADGYPLRQLLIGGMYALWSLRLGFYLSKRVIGQPEEGRYQQLRSDWGRDGDPKFKFLAFYLFQALLNVVLSLPLLIACLNPAPELHWLEIAGVLIYLTGLVGESVADAQLAAFKRDPHNHGKVCNAGLWRYSRHPNYFFEWVIWIGYAVFALPSQGGWLALLMPVLMLHFLVNVTGVKATEEQALRSKGDLYREYQRTTSPFVPWFPRHSSPGQG